MSHTHKYEPLSHRSISVELLEFGIEAAEMRICRKCSREMPFVQTKKGDWIPLFSEEKADQQGILLA